MSQKESEKDHKCGGELCIVCGYREKIKKSDWEKSFEEKFPELWGSNDGREGYDRDVKSDVKAFIQEILSNREKEIADEVESLKPIQQMINGEFKDTGFVEKEAVLQIIKH